LQFLYDGFVGKYTTWSSVTCNGTKVLAMTGIDPFKICFGG